MVRYATHDSSTGQRKQSVGDVERLLNLQIADFMEHNGYIFEARYVRTIHNWKQAID